MFGVWTSPAARSRCWSATSAARGSRWPRSSAMVRFFVEARAWDAERPGGGAGAGRPDPVGAPAPSASFVTAFLGVVADGRAALRERRPRRRPCPCAPRASRRRSRPRGCRWASRTRRALRGARDRRSSAATCCSPRTDGLIEARRERIVLRRRGAVGAAGRARPHAPPAARRADLPRREAWTPTLHDDVVVLALRPCQIEMRDEPATGPAAQALFAESRTSCASGWGAFVPTEDIFGHRGRLRRGAPRAGRATTRAGAGGVRRLALARARGRGDQADVRDRERAPPGPRAAGAGRARAAGGGARRARVRLLSTEVLREARALYAVSELLEAEVMDVGGAAARTCGGANPRVRSPAPRLAQFAVRGGTRAAGTAPGAWTRWSSHPAEGVEASALPPCSGAWPTFSPTSTISRARSRCGAPRTPRQPWRRWPRCAPRCGGRRSARPAVASPA